MHCIGVDVSKQELVTYDGKKERIFPNTRGLDAFARFIKRATDPTTSMPAQRCGIIKGLLAAGSSIQAISSTAQSHTDPGVADQLPSYSRSEEPSYHDQANHSRTGIRRRLGIQYGI